MRAVTALALVGILAVLLHGTFAPLRVESHWADPDAGTTCYVARTAFSVAIDCDE